MGQKTNPIALRININRNFDSMWYEETAHRYGRLLHTDLKIRDFIKSLFSSLKIFTGRIHIQIFAKKIVLHHFFHNPSRYEKTLRKTRKHRFGKKSIAESTEPAKPPTPLVWARPESVFLSNYQNQNISKKPSQLIHSLKPFIEKKRELSLSSKSFLLRAFYLASKPSSILDTLALANRNTLEQMPSSRELITKARSDLQDFQIQSLLWNFKEMAQRSNKNFVPWQTKLPKLRSSAQDHGSGKADGNQGSRSYQSRSSVLSRNKGITKINTSKPSIEGSTFHHLQSILGSYTQSQMTMIPCKFSSPWMTAQSLCDHIVQGLQKRMRLKRIFEKILGELKKQKTFKGIRILCSGRIRGAEMARSECRKYGATSLHIFSERIDYACMNAFTPQGLLGVKVWLSLQPGQSPRLIDPGLKIRKFV